MIPMETMLVATIGRIPLTISSVIPGIGAYFPNTLKPSRNHLGLSGREASNLLGPSYMAA